MRVHMEHGSKHITFYVQKHIASLAMCYNPPLVRDKSIGAPVFVKLVYLTGGFVAVLPRCLSNLMDRHLGNHYPAHNEVFPHYRSFVWGIHHSPVLTKGCEFFLSWYMYHEQAFEQTVELPVILDITELFISDTTAGVPVTATKTHVDVTCV